MSMSDSEKVRWPFFSKKFKQLLEDAPLTVYRICEETTLRSSNMSKIVNGTRRATDDVLETLNIYRPDIFSVSKMKGWRAIDEAGAEAIREAMEEIKKNKEADCRPDDDKRRA